MHTIKIALLCLTGLVALAGALLVLPEVSAATFDYELDPDEVEQKRVDVETEISFDTLLTNNKDENRQFQVEVTNASDLKNRQHIIATFDDANDDTSSKRTATVTANGGTVNVVIYIKAKWNGIRGFHQATIKASDVDFQEELFLQLKFVVNENFSVELVNLDQDPEGSADIEDNDGEYTYRFRIDNTGNSADKFDVKIIDSGWDSDLDFQRTRVRAYHSHPFNITVTPDNGLDYGEEDDIRVRVISNHDSDNQDRYRCIGSA